MSNVSEGISGNEKMVVVKVEAPAPTNNQQPKQGGERGYKRHTKQQIEELESFFNQCPYPCAMERRELAHQLDLKPKQIKFWFQNRHAKIKRAENKRIAAERIAAENQRERIAAENQRENELLSKCEISGVKQVKIEDSS